ncbi:MAG: hypothetical protein IJT76_04830 [Clostridia bacterium]|nr:hypothetical protein [Clostridia bacterium]
MKKKHPVWALIMVILTCCLFCVFFRGKTVKEWMLLPDKSFFSEYSVVEKQVLIRCDIMVKKLYGTPRQFTLKAVLPKDVKGGLLKEEMLTGWADSLKETVFIIDEKYEERFVVVFAGPIAENSQKCNRNLPEIVIADISESSAAVLYLFST